MAEDTAYFHSIVANRALAHINILALQGKPSGGAVGTQVAELKVATLVFGADTSVDSDSHGFVLPPWETGKLKSRRTGQQR